MSGGAARGNGLVDLQRRCRAALLRAGRQLQRLRRLILVSVAARLRMPRVLRNTARATNSVGALRVLRALGTAMRRWIAHSSGLYAHSESVLHIMRPLWRTCTL